MIVKMYSIYDSKAEAYMQPFFAQSNGVAIRSFTNAANDKGSAIGQYPTDFTLFELGSFDDSNGDYVALTAPKPLGGAHEFVKGE